VLGPLVVRGGVVGRGVVDGGVMNHWGRVVGGGVMDHGGGVIGGGVVDHRVVRGSGRDISGGVVDYFRSHIGSGSWVIGRWGGVVGSGGGVG